MKIVTPQDFLLILKNKFLLLDTSVFIDAQISPVEFDKFFNQLKENGTTLMTIDAVLLEFIKGAQDVKKLKEKREFVEQIVESYLHEDRKIFSYAFKLVELYKEEGKGVSMTDFILGATLMYYHRNNLFLLTKNPSDFPTNIFTLKTYLNLFHRKAIHSYGVYSFEENKLAPPSESRRRNI